jgi:hypothetical protein
LRSSAHEFREASFVRGGRYGISAVVSVAASGDLPRPSATLVVEAGLWVFAELGFYAVLAVGLASLTGSCAYTIGILLAWRTAVSHILVSISALGVYRELLPDVPFARLAPDAVEENVREVPSHIGISLPRVDRRAAALGCSADGPRSMAHGNSRRVTRPGLKSSRICHSLCA